VKLCLGGKCGKDFINAIDVVFCKDAVCQGGAGGKVKRFANQWWFSFKWMNNQGFSFFLDVDFISVGKLAEFDPFGRERDSEGCCSLFDDFASHLSKRGEEVYNFCVRIDVYTKIYSIGKKNIFIGICHWQSNTGVQNETNNARNHGLVHACCMFN